MSDELPCAVRLAGGQGRVPPIHHSLALDERSLVNHAAKPFMNSGRKQAGVALQNNWNGAVNFNQRRDGHGVPGADAPAGGVEDFPRPSDADIVFQIKLPASLGVESQQVFDKALRSPSLQQALVSFGNLRRNRWNWSKATGQSLEAQPGTSDDHRTPATQAVESTGNIGNPVANGIPAIMLDMAVEAMGNELLFVCRWPRRQNAPATVDLQRVGVYDHAVKP